MRSNIQEQVDPSIALYITDERTLLLNFTKKRDGLYFACEG